MTQLKYSFIKSNIVTNICAFEEEDHELLENFKNIFSSDSYVIATDYAVVGGTYDGEKFWSPQPYSSWIKNEEKNEWEAPVPYPTDGKEYLWNEDTLNWIEVTE